MSAYPLPPPTYGAADGSSNTKYTDDPATSRDPFHDFATVGAGSSAAGRAAFYDQPSHGDLPDDFKYGVTVSESSVEIRLAFIRKVYSILFCQILATTVVGGVISQSPSAVQYVKEHTWAFYVPLFGTLVNLGLLYWKRHSHPTNYILLSTFTLMEAFTLGVIVAFYNNVVVLEALIITLAVFLGLTLFTFQSKYDFEGLGPWLFGGLIALLGTGIVAMFFPYNRTFDLIMAGFGCLIFSGYIVYDTHVITTKLSPDEFIMGAISLYLDFINLFINILRLMGNSDR